MKILNDAHIWRSEKAQQKKIKVFTDTSICVQVGVSMIHRSTHIGAKEFMYEFINTYLLGAEAQIE